MDKEQSLYAVTIKGRETFYVIAKDPNQAYVMVRSNLNDKDRYFTKERALDNIKLIASEGDYPECGTRLLMLL